MTNDNKCVTSFKKALKLPAARSNQMKGGKKETKGKE